MKKSVLTIAAATAVFTLAFSGQAKAEGLRINGIQWNGWSLNGWQLNGVRLKAAVLPGTSMQATKLYINVFFIVSISVRGSDTRLL